MNLIKLFEEVLSSKDQYEPLLKMAKAHKKYEYSSNHFSYGDNEGDSGFGFKGFVRDNGSVYIKIFLKIEIPDFYRYTTIFDDDIDPNSTDQAVLDFIEGKASYEDFMEFAKNSPTFTIKKFNDILEKMGENQLKASFSKAQAQVTKKIRAVTNKIQGISSYLSNVDKELPGKISQYYKTIWDEWQKDGGPQEGSKCEVLFCYPGNEVVWQKCQIDEVKEINGHTMVKFFFPSHSNTNHYSERRFYAPLERCRPLSDYNDSEFDSSENISQFIRAIPDTTGYDLVVGLTDLY